MAPGTQQDPALTHSPPKCLWITRCQPANARLERAETLEIDISQGFFLGKINPYTFNCRTILPAQNQLKTPCFRALAARLTLQKIGERAFYSTVAPIKAFEPDQRCSDGLWRQLSRPARSKSSSWGRSKISSIRESLRHSLDFHCAGTLSTALFENQPTGA